MRSRNYSLDVLKTIGMVFIVLAHCRGVPDILNYIRNFEVFLLVIVSVVLMYPKYESCTELTRSIKKNIDKRIIRLVIPTWFFLTVLFFVLWSISRVNGRAFPYSMNAVVESYLMINGIGYVWIMLVYCWIAIGVPTLFILFNRYIKKRKLQALFLFVLYVVYELTRYLIIYVMPEGAFQYYLKNTVLYFAIYVIVSFVPYILKKIEDSMLVKFGGCLLAVHFIVLALILVNKGNALACMAACKFPPSLFYITYALGISLILLYVLDRINITNGVLKSIFSFISKNSQWVYFNHILMIYVWNEMINTNDWYIMWLFVFVGAIAITKIQRIVIDLMKKGHINPVNKFLDIIFG